MILKTSKKMKKDDKCHGQQNQKCILLCIAYLHANINYD